MFSFVLSIILSFCEQDNLRSRYRTSTKHSRHGQGVILIFGIFPYPRVDSGSFLSRVSTLI